MEKADYHSLEDKIKALESEMKLMQMTSEQASALFERTEQAITFGMSLDKADGQTLLDMSKSYLHLQEQLEANELTLRKLRRLLGMEPSSEKSKPKDTDSDHQPKEADDLTAAEQPSEPSEETDDKKSKKARKGGHGKKAAKDFENAHIQKHSIKPLSKGDICPACGQGKVYKFEPSVLIRITGHNPYQVTKHICERLRCNACGELFTAQLSDDVLSDGPKTQRYGYSARALIAIDKYMAGSPLYRQQSLTEILGEKISASSAYDQCEKLADSGQFIHRALSQAAADSPKIYIDDTWHRIREAQPFEKGGKTRSGVYTSCLIGDGGTRKVVVFKTNIGHAGELLDATLKKRDPSLPTPLLMSDALSSNFVTNEPFIKSLCNSHARREFEALSAHEPVHIQPILELYGKVFANEGVCISQGLSEAERLDYHQKNSLPLMKELLTLTSKLVETDKVFEENSNFGKAHAYFKRHWEDLTAFCRIKSADITNNLTERVIKQIVLGRKNFYFYKTPAGAAVSDIITSLIATCKINAINPFLYLKAIQIHQAAAKETPDKWLPWNYQQNLV